MKEKLVEILQSNLNCDSLYTIAQAILSAGFVHRDEVCLGMSWSVKPVNKKPSRDYMKGYQEAIEGCQSALKQSGIMTKDEVKKGILKALPKERTGCCCLADVNCGCQVEDFNESLKLCREAVENAL